MVDKIVSEYDQEIPQSQTALKPWHCEKEPHKNNETPRRQTKRNCFYTCMIKGDCSYLSGGGGVFHH